jgi:hypothetical protein
MKQNKRTITKQQFQKFDYHHKEKRKGEIKRKIYEYRSAPTTYQLEKGRT